MIRFMAPALLLVAGLVAGCGSLNSSAGTGAGKQTAANQKYTDARYAFSFEYPQSWKIKGQGRVENLGGVSTYVVHLQLPGGQDDAQITVDHSLSNYSWIPEGKVAPIPNSTGTYHYHHLKVSGRPALQVTRKTGNTPDEYDTIVNTAHLSFDVRMLAGQPPFSAGAKQGYDTVIQTLSLPF